MSVKIFVAVLVPLVLLLSACSEPATFRSAETSPAPPASPPHGLDARQVARGGEIYRAHCAVCHGANAEGAPNWHVRGPDGKLPPPPLDAGGHAWHHTSAWLADMIKKGTLHRGGGMPGWEGKLSEDDIGAVIVWMQSRWPEEIYRNWLVLEEKGKQAGHSH